MCTFQRCIDYVDVAGRSPLGVYNHNTEQNGDFQVRENILQMVSNTAMVKLTIKLLAISYG